MDKNILIHIPHSSLYIPDDYKNKILITKEELEKENKFMCDYKIDEIVENKNQTIIFPYSRLYCDVERFRDSSEVMNKYGMGYIYTKTSDGKKMFEPSIEHIEKINKIYEHHHEKLNNYVSNILNKYNNCLIIDLHSYSSDLVLKLFNYQNVPDICIGIEENYYSEELTNYFINYFEKYGYSVKINYPYKGSLIPNEFYGRKNTNIVSIMIEVNKRIYLKNDKKFKKVLNRSLNNVHF